MFNKKIVIYTAIDRGTYILKDQKFVPDNAKLIAIINKNIPMYGWAKMRLEKKYEEDRRLNYKWYKMMPHLIFPEYEYSLWMDSIFVLNGDINPYFEKYLSDANAAFFKHHANRDCLYEEGHICADLKLAPRDTVNEQLSKYKQDGYPEHNGLIMSGIILRKHHEKDVINCMEQWFEETKTFCRRDQVSFNYVAWKNNFKFNYINDKYNHPIFHG
ncbi:MAG: DUF616 domain-containing protein [bacterium]|nr:DUF616 domain-containing protein [bacterium]